MPLTCEQWPGGPSAATGSMHLKKVQKQLTDAASLFALPVKDALELWLDITDELPRHTQHPHTAAATDLVQAALQQAPRPMKSSDPRQLVWLQTHLPGISTAMQSSLSSQMHTSIRRATIADSLAKARPKDAQLRARAYAEYTTCVYMEPLCQVFYLIFPVGALCGEMSRPSKARQEEVSSEYGRHHQQQQQHRLQQGNELISMVGADLSHRAGIREKLEEQKLPVHRHVLTQRLQWQPPPGLHGSLAMAHFLLTQATFMWLQLISSLPPGHKDTVLFLDAIYWQQLEYHDRLDQQHVDTLRRLLYQLLGTKLTFHWRQQKPDLLREVLHFLGITSQHLQGAGIPGADQRQLFAFMQDTHPGADQPDALHVPRQHNQQAGGQLSAGSNHTAGSSQGVGDDSKGSATADGSEPELGCDGEGDLNDMQTLLRMMYGSTLESAQPQAIEPQVADKAAHGMLQNYQQLGCAVAFNILLNSRVQAELQ